jgi:meso-butanediol dehydrogenase/(S,S)-butanediol dehydrogenase/diacetyl reductase
MVGLVVGGGRGIGRGIALQLARAGADVAIADISVEMAAETAHLVEQQGRRSLALKANVVDYADVEAMVQKTVSVFGRLDIAANNAGVAGFANVVDMDPAEWDRVLNVNLRGVFYCCKAELNAMLPRKFGRIVNTASIAGKIGMASVTHYCASKFGVIGFTASLAKEVALDGITVNAVCPGIVETAMWRGENGAAGQRKNPDETEEQSWARQKAWLSPQGDAQTPEDIGDMVVYLATARHVTGQALAIDGGHTL